MSPFPTIFAALLAAGATAYVLGDHFFSLFALYLIVMPLTTELWQRLVVIPRLQREMDELHERRIGRVRQALDKATSMQWTVPSPAPGYAFLGWVDLTAQGTVGVAGKQFSPNESFQVSATDERCISRAMVSSNGSGKILIHSHGLAYAAVFANGNWLIETLEPPIV